MKINLLEIFLILLLLPSLSSTPISLFSAQNIATNYVSDNEMLDIYVQQSISCNSKSYYVIPVVNSSKDISFFVPISVDSGEVYFSKNKSNNLQLIKTAYVLRFLYQSSNTNYLSQQLLDKIDREITILDSKRAQLDGIINSNYSEEINSCVRDTKSKLDTLINLLSNLHTSLSSLLKDQQNFLLSPDCKDVDSLVSKFKSSFNGYNNLTSSSLDYRDSINEISKSVFSDESLDDTTKRWILSNTSAPINLNSEINYIYESLSSTSSFYSSIYETSSKILEDKGINLFLNNFISKRDYVEFNTLLYSYDSDLNNYSNLDYAINYILDPKQKSYWKSQDLVDSLSNNYNKLNYLLSKGEYSQCVLYAKKLKVDVIKILDNGFQNIEQENKFYNNLFIFILLVLILILFIIIKNGKGKKKIKSTTKKSKKIINKTPESLNDLLKYKDPFK